MSAPGEVGLLEVVDASFATAEQDFAKLVEQRRRGRGDVALTYRHAQHRLGAARLPLEARRIFTQQFGKRYPVDAGHFRRVRNEFSGAPAPDHDRGHHETRAGGEIIKAPEHRLLRQLEADLLREFPQGTHLRRFTGVQTATGQCPLSRVPAQVARPPGENQGRLVPPLAVLRETVEVRAKALLDNGEGHRRVMVVIDIVAAHAERSEPTLQQLPQARTAEEIRFVDHDTFANR